jgi:hypothetical protein
MRMGIDGITLTGENRNTGRKASLCATSSISNTSHIGWPEKKSESPWLNVDV